jgi:hypothetical protein
MVPAALTGDTVDALAARMIRDDVIVAERELAQAA